MDLENITATASHLAEFERKMAQLYQEGKVAGPAHFCAGNEEQLIRIFRGLRPGEYVRSSERHVYSREVLMEKKLVEVYSSVDEKSPIFHGIRPNDWVFASYRSHSHALLKGMPETWLAQQITEGKSMYPISREYNFITSAIVPGHIPIAMGTALGFKRRGDLYHVWAFCGDMAAETGIFEEVTKYADHFKLPITFVIEDNGKSVDTPTLKVWGGQSPLRRANTIRYVYDLKVPHQGVGKEVGF